MIVGLYIYVIYIYINILLICNRIYLFRLTKLSFEKAQASRLWSVRDGLSVSVGLSLRVCTDTRVCNSIINNNIRGMYLIHSVIRSFHHEGNISVTHHACEELQPTSRLQTTQWRRQDMRWGAQHEFFLSSPGEIFSSSEIVLICFREF